MIGLDLLFQGGDFQNNVKDERLVKGVWLRDFVGFNEGYRDKEGKEKMDLK